MNGRISTVVAAAALLCACPNTTGAPDDADGSMDAGTATDGPSAIDATSTGVDDARLVDGASMPLDARSIDAMVSRDASSSDATPPRPSAGCGTPQASGYTCSSITIRGVARQYCVMVPTTYEASRPMRVRYSLHGCGGSISMTGTADDGPFIVVYPKSVASCWEQCRFSA